MPNLSLKRSLSDFWVLIVPGLNNSGPQHWQSRWERLYPAFERIEQKY
ncbi:alpha/beta hydrolase, partial [Glaciimonas sp. CA11.2]